MADAKVCKDCLRVNLPDAEVCVGCGGEDFDTLDFTPPWDSAEAYSEEKKEEES